MGRAFVSWYDPTVVCEPVWDGTSTPYLMANKDDSPGSLMPSSLNEGPARLSKPNGPSGSGRASRGNGVVSQSVGRI